MIVFDFIAYMDEVARKLKDIGHTDTNHKFFRISGLAGLEELIANLPDAQYPALMVVENPEGAITDNGGDNFTDIPTHEFYVAIKYDFGNDTARAKAKADCKAIGQKIISRMLRHNRERSHNLNYMRFGRVPYFTIGPFGDMVIAVYFQIEVPQYAGTVYNHADWTE